jgi:DNA primase
MAGLFSQETLERVRSASDIVEIVGSCLPLRRAGANFVALCPFHREKTPSFNVNPTKQIFHCFGCHKGGDVFKFIEEYESLSFGEAVRRLAERARIPLEFEKGAGDSATRNLKETLLAIHEQITTRWQSALANESSGAIAREYLAKRAVSSEAVSLFRLGYAPEVWDDTVNWARSKSHDLATVEKAGLILRKEGTDHYYDRFRGRLIFPICDEQGRVIGFSGRILSGDEKTAKYVNSPETPIFTKSKVFYGLDKSRRSLLDAGHAVICEGQLDLIACYMSGVQNVVAPQGTAFTADHARILRRYVTEVVLCFDSDEAGQNAAARSLEHLLVSGLAVRVAVVPAPHDPDSFIKESGAEAFKELLQRAEGFFDFYLKRLCSLHDSTSDKGRIQILRSMAEALRKTSNAVIIDTYAQKTAFRLGVKAEAVRAEFKKAPAVRTREIATEATDAPDAVFEMPSNNERWLLKLLLLHEDLVPWAEANLKLDWLLNPLAREILGGLFRVHNKRTWTSVATFLADFESTEARTLITELVTEDRPLPHPAQQLGDLALRLRNAEFDRQIAALLQRVSLPETSDQQKIEALRLQQDLRTQKRQPLASVPTL